VVRTVQIFRAAFVTEGMSAVLDLGSVAMSARRQALGRRAEDLVAARLAAAGWRVVERNARSRYGEIDLVALDRGALVFVEVKAGRAGSAYGPERPVLAVDRRKQRRVRRLAAAWLAERRDLPRYAEIRFDAVGVTFDRGGRAVDFEHIAGAF
jgi:putative endonuclease